MRTNCFTIRTVARVVWSGVVFPTMRVSFMTLVSAKAQEAFRPLSRSAPHGPSSRTTGTVSSPPSYLFIPIPRSLVLGQRLSPMLCTLVCPIPLRSVIVSDLNRLRCDSVLTQPLWRRSMYVPLISVSPSPCSILVASPCSRLVALVFRYVNVHRYCLASSVARTGLMSLVLVTVVPSLYGTISSL